MESLHNPCRCIFISPSTISRFVVDATENPAILYRATYTVTERIHCVSGLYCAKGLWVRNSSACLASGSWVSWYRYIKTAVSIYHDMPFLSPLITSPRFSRHSTKLGFVLSINVAFLPFLRHACVKIRCQLVIVAKDECRPGWLAPIFHSNSPEICRCNTCLYSWQLNQQNNENLKSRITAGFNLKPEPLSQSEGRLLLAPSVIAFWYPE